MAIRVLCVTGGGDRPTIETFIGMHRAGVDITVISPSDYRFYPLLADAGVPLIDLKINTNFDRQGAALLREELLRGRYHIMHTFNSHALSNGLRACRNLPVKVVAYRGIVGNLSVLDPFSWMRYLNPRIDRIVCVCEAIRTWFLEMKPAFLRVPDTRPVTIHKGHKLEWYTDTPADLAADGITILPVHGNLSTAFLGRPPEHNQPCAEGVHPGNNVLLRDVVVPDDAKSVERRPEPFRLDLRGEETPVEDPLYVDSAR